MGRRTVDIEGDKLELEAFERDQKPERREIRERHWALNELERRRKPTDQAKKPKEDKTDG